MVDFQDTREIQDGTFTLVNFGNTGAQRIEKEDYLQEGKTT